MQIGWILFIGIAIISWLVQSSLQSKFNKFSKIPLGNGMTGKDVAEKMLRDNGIYDVSVVHVKGQLTDHYNPAKKTINLSDIVYSSDSVAAAAVAAHECGHAVQHATAYGPLKMRSNLVPITSFASQWVNLVILGGLFFFNTFPELLWFGISLFAVTTLFSFITLPVEIDASKRAISWLTRTGVATPSVSRYAVSALRSAAYTYVVAAAGSLATLMYYISIASNRK